MKPYGCSVFWAIWKMTDRMWCHVVVPPTFSLSSNIQKKGVMAPMSRACVVMAMMWFRMRVISPYRTTSTSDSAWSHLQQKCDEGKDRHTFLQFNSFGIFQTIFCHSSEVYNVRVVHSRTVQGSIAFSSCDFDVHFFTLEKVLLCLWHVVVTAEKGLIYAWWKKTTNWCRLLSSPLVGTSDPLCTDWGLDVEQLLHGQRVGLLIAHHGNIVQTVKVGQSLSRFIEEEPMLIKSGTSTNGTTHNKRPFTFYLINQV